MTRYPTVERALELELPMLLVAGTRDPLVSREHLQSLVERKPNMTLVIQDRAAHAINFSHPRELANVVRSWTEDQPIILSETAAKHVQLVEAPEVPEDTPAM
jgi:pimeloyl-ACP methyl ester carboxylesterase